MAGRAARLSIPPRFVSGARPQRGWHHHVTLVFLDWAFLQTQRRGRKRGPNAGRSHRPAARCSKPCFAGRAFASRAVGRSTAGHPARGPRTAKEVTY
jgi:hypothetical protein